MCYFPTTPTFPQIAGERATFLSGLGNGALWLMGRPRFEVPLAPNQSQYTSRGGKRRAGRGGETGHTDYRSGSVCRHRERRRSHKECDGSGARYSNRNSCTSLVHAKVFQSSSLFKLKLKYYLVVFHCRPVTVWHLLCLATRTVSLNSPINPKLRNLIIFSQWI